MWYNLIRIKKRTLQQFQFLFEKGFFMVYEGKEKYIFVSYAHKDEARVVPIIRWLCESGCRIWYDGGLEVGATWTAEIQDRLTNCSAVLFFASSAAVQSENCRNEIYFALEQKKEVLGVYLEKTELKYGLGLQLTKKHFLDFNRYQNKELFYRELLQSRTIRACCRTDFCPAGSIPKPTAKKKIWRSAGAVFLGVLFVASLIFMWENKTVVRDKAPKVPKQSELFEYKVEIAGTEIQLPCACEDMISDGWRISSSGVFEHNEVEPNGYESFFMTRGSYSVEVYFFNRTDSPKKLKDCVLGGIGDGDGICFPNGITNKSTVEEIVEAYGEPNERTEDGDYITLTYRQANSEDMGVRFTRFQGGAGYEIYLDQSVKFRH